MKKVSLMTPVQVSDNGLKVRKRGYLRVFGDDLLNLLIRSIPTLAATLGSVLCFRSAAHTQDFLVWLFSWFGGLSGLALTVLTYTPTGHGLWMEYVASVKDRANQKLLE